MRKAFKYRLYPNTTTEKKLYSTLNRCRELYNAALSERKDSYQLHERTQLQINSETGQVIVATMTAKQRVKAVSYYGQKRNLVEIKALREEYQGIASHVLQDVILRVERAFQRFFDGAGFPRFKGRTRYDSFTYPDGAGWKLDVEEQGNSFKGTLHLSKIGDIKVRLHRKIEGKIKTVTIKREVDQWFVVFSCAVEEPAPLPLSYEEVGIDLGVTHLATLSNGEMIEHPRYYRRAKKTLEKRQQALSRKKQGSHRRERTKKLIGKAHRKIANQRRGFPQETGQYLPNGAAAKGGLNKSILDAGWGMFVGMCSSKAAGAGRTLLKVSPYATSQVCSSCGTVRKKTLEERWHSCNCGAEMDRDVNAAKNILVLGQQQLGGKRPTSATA